MGTCKVCKKNFGLFRWRHTCQICGGAICRDCSAKIPIDSLEKYVALESIQSNISFLDTKDSELDDDYKSLYLCPTLCPTCHGTYNSKLRAIIENINRIGKENVRLYSSRYQGKLPKHTKEIHLKTFFHRDKNEAEDELKVYAASIGCRDVIDIRYNKKSKEYGNYIYSVFQYEGKGIK